MMPCPIVTITRKESFASAHRLHSIHLSDDENRKIFGKCNSLNGHGHNYVVEVSIRGPVDSKTGMVMNLTELKEVINQCVMKPLDHKNVDKDVLYFKAIPSTAENIAVFIWDSLTKRLEKPELLYEVKLWETDKNYVVYHGTRADNQHINTFNRQTSEAKFCANMSSDSE